MDDDKVEARVLWVLRVAGRTNPQVLVRFLESEGQADTAIRKAIWRLLDRKEIILTPGRDLETA